MLFWLTQKNSELTQSVSEFKIIEINLLSYSQSQISNFLFHIWLKFPYFLYGVFQNKSLQDKCNKYAENKYQMIKKKYKIISMKS